MLKAIKYLEQFKTGYLAQGEDEPYPVRKVSFAGAAGEQGQEPVDLTNDEVFVAIGRSPKLDSAASGYRQARMSNLYFIHPSLSALHDKLSRRDPHATEPDEKGAVAIEDCSRHGTIVWKRKSGELVKLAHDEPHILENGDIVGLVVSDHLSPDEALSGGDWQTNLLHLFKFARVQFMVAIEPQSSDLYAMRFDTGKFRKALKLLLEEECDVGEVFDALYKMTVPTTHELNNFWTVLLGGSLAPLDPDSEETIEESANGDILDNKEADAEDVVTRDNSPEDEVATSDVDDKSSKAHEIPEIVNLVDDDDDDGQAQNEVLDSGSQSESEIDRDIAAEVDNILGQGDDATSNGVYEILDISSDDNDGEEVAEDNVENIEVDVEVEDDDEVWSDAEPSEVKSLKVTIPVSIPEAAPAESESKDKSGSEAVPDSEAEVVEERDLPSDDSADDYEASSPESSADEYRADPTDDLADIRSFVDAHLKQRKIRQKETEEENAKFRASMCDAILLGDPSVSTQIHSYMSPRDGEAALDSYSCLKTGAPELSVEDDSKDYVPDGSSESAEENDSEASDNDDDDMTLVDQLRADMKNPPDVSQPDLISCECLKSGAPELSAVDGSDDYVPGKSPEPSDQSESEVSDGEDNEASVSESDAIRNEMKENSWSKYQSPVVEEKHVSVPDFETGMGNMVDELNTLISKSIEKREAREAGEDVVDDSDYMGENSDSSEDMDVDAESSDSVSDGDSDDSVSAESGSDAESDAELSDNASDSESVESRKRRHEEEEDDDEEEAVSESKKQRVSTVSDIKSTVSSIKEILQDKAFMEQKEALNELHEFLENLKQRQEVQDQEENKRQVKAAKVRFMKKVQYLFTGASLGAIATFSALAHLGNV